MRDSLINQLLIRKRMEQMNIVCNIKKHIEKLTTNLENESDNIKSIIRNLIKGCNFYMENVANKHEKIDDALVFILYNLKQLFILSGNKTYV